MSLEDITQPGVQLRAAVDALETLSARRTAQCRAARALCDSYPSPDADGPAHDRVERERARDTWLELRGQVLAVKEALDCVKAVGQHVDISTWYE